MNYFALLTYSYLGSLQIRKAIVATRGAVTSTTDRPFIMSSAFAPLSVLTFDRFPPPPLNVWYMCGVRERGKSAIFQISGFQYT